MKLKGLVLGAAAGAIAVTGAQAADLPVVEPVDYVRICDAYGSGFYFIPGTETCLRVAGRVRVDYQFFGDLQENFEILGTRGYDDDTDRGYRFRARAYLYMDSRTNTEFGLLRTFTELQAQMQDGVSNTTVEVERAFIQFGGLTFGNTRSFYDFSDAYYGSFFFFVPNVSDNHTMVAAYTAAFGNGFSASISIEDSIRRTALPIVPGGQPAPLVTARPAWVPDVVGNIRVDQGWGSAQLMGMIGYREIGVSNVNGDFAQSDADVAFAIGGGVNVNVPFGNGTSVGIQGTYARNAVLYADAGIGGFIGDGFYNVVTNNLSATDAFSVHGGVSTSFTPNISGTLGAGYTYADNNTVTVNKLDIDGFIGYSPVAGFVLGAGLQYEYVEQEIGAATGSGGALAGFLRAQRTF